MALTSENLERAGPANEYRSVSVIVPTFNRAVTLADTLESLLKQNYPAHLMEVVVVDNSSTDHTAAVVATARERAPFPIHYFRVENRGPAVARNFGVAHSTGEVLAFTDSDCTVPSNWLTNLTRQLHPGMGFVAGPVRPVIHPQRIPDFFYHQTDHSEPNGFFPTANILYRRETFERAGGFDEQFGAFSWGPPVGGEDIDLAWRVIRAGCDSAWAEDAPVNHEASSQSPREWLLEPLRTQIIPRMVAKYPELRRSLHCRVFTGRENPAIYLAAIGIGAALASRRPLALALTTPWLWVMHSMVDRDVRRPRRWWRIPLKYTLTAVRSAVLGGALISASLRHRAVVI